MQLKPRYRDRKSAIANSPMADVGFLLLIFFLVAATIDADSGLRLQWPAAGGEPPPISERNLLNVFVRSDGEVLVDGRPLSIDDVRSEVAQHIKNNGAHPNYAIDAQHAIVSFKAGRDVSYGLYIDALDAILVGYRDVHDGHAREVFGTTDYASYLASLGQESDRVREAYPIKLSMAEPDAR